MAYKGMSQNGLHCVDLEAAVGLHDECCCISDCSDCQMMRIDDRRYVCVCVLISEHAWLV